MKKFILSAAAALALLTSCGGAAGPSLSEYGVDTQAITTGMSELIEQAKANGESWELDDWKNAYRELNKLSQPVLRFSAQMTQAMQADATEAAQKYEKAAEELGEFTPKYQELTQAFMAVANETGAAQAIAEDADFQQELAAMANAAMQQ